MEANGTDPDAVIAPALGVWVVVEDECGQSMWLRRSTMCGGADRPHRRTNAWLLHGASAAGAQVSAVKFCATEPAALSVASLVEALAVGEPVFSGCPPACGLPVERRIG